MLRFASVAGLAVLFATAASAQVAPDVIYPAVARSATSAQGFVPAGWVLEREVSGDLNGDGRADLALVLHMNNPANVVALGDGSDADTFDSNPRILAVALAQGSGYRLLVANHALIPRVDNYARTDPLDDSGGTPITISNGVLKVQLTNFMSAGGWEMGGIRYTFRVTNGTLRLIGYDSNQVTRNTGCSVNLSVNYNTRRATREVGTIESSRGRTTNLRLSGAAAPTIDQIADGFSFDPDNLSTRYPYTCPTSRG